MTNIELELDQMLKELAKFDGNIYIALARRKISKSRLLEGKDILTNVLEKLNRLILTLHH